MPDCQGRPLRAGDKVVVTSTNKGLVFGKLRYDEHEKPSYHVELTADGVTQMYYPQKPTYAKNNNYILNLTLYMEEENVRL
jgi:hypothetical protein